MKRYKIYKGSQELILDSLTFHIALAVLVIGLIVPPILSVETLGIYNHMSVAVVYEEKNALLTAAVLLVFMNALRGLPFYMGTYLVGESYTRSSRSPVLDVGRGAVTLAVLGICYISVEALYGIHYDFGLPALLLTGFVILYRHLDFNRVRLTRRLLILLWVMNGVQCLDIMPAFGPTAETALLRWLPVGRGEISLSIKQIAVDMDATMMLDITGAVGFIFFNLFALTQLIAVGHENEARELVELTRQNEEIRLQMRESEIKNRINGEIRYLVHDLKSPLTAMQTMVGVLQLTLADRPDELGLLERMDTSMAQMNRMIGEIQNSESRGPVTPREVLHLAMAQLSVTEFARYITMNDQAEDTVFLANRILLSRAFVNLLQNAAKAVPAGRTPQLSVTVTEEDAQLLFEFRDNGAGFSPEVLPHMWEVGVSGSGSTGLGLVFVKKVIEENRGTITVDSVRNRGTVFRIRIPKGAEP